MIDDAEPQPRSLEAGELTDDMLAGVVGGAGGSADADLKAKLQFEKSTKNLDEKAKALDAILVKEATSEAKSITDGANAILGILVARSSSGPKTGEAGETFASAGVSNRPGSHNEASDLNRAVEIVGAYSSAVHNGYQATEAQVKALEGVKAAVTALANYHNAEDLVAGTGVSIKQDKLHDGLLTNLEKSLTDFGKSTSSYAGERNTANPLNVLDKVKDVFLKDPKA